MRETVIETDEIYDGRLVKLVRHHVRLPDDKVTLREVINHPGAVALVALDEEQRVLLVQQFRLPAQQVLFELPAGTLEADEEPGDCAIRELQEETGYKPNQLIALGGFYAAPGYTTEFIHLFLARDLEVSRLKTDDDEFIVLDAIPFNMALTMIEQGKIVDGKTIAGLYRVARHLGV